jgi:hypothetical protein
MKTFGRRRAALEGHQDHVPPPDAHYAAAEIPLPIPHAPPRSVASDRVT